MDIDNTYFIFWALSNNFFSSSNNFKEFCRARVDLRVLEPAGCYDSYASFLFSSFHVVSKYVILPAGGE